MRATDSPKTTLRRITSIRSFGRWAGVAVLMDYRAPKPADPRPHPLPEGIDGVLTMLYEASTAHHRALIALCGLSGTRINEALVCAPGDIDVLDKMLLVHGKGAKEREVPISAKAWLFIEPALDRARLDGEPLCAGIADRTARAYITSLGKRCGFERPISSHDLRATYATELHGRGVPLVTIQRLLGHARSDTTEVYIGVTRDAMREAVEAL